MTNHMLEVPVPCPVGTPVWVVLPNVDKQAYFACPAVYNGYEADFSTEGLKVTHYVREVSLLGDLLDEDVEVDPLTVALSKEAALAAFMDNHPFEPVFVLANPDPLNFSVGA